MHAESVWIITAITFDIEEDSYQLGLHQEIDDGEDLFQTVYVSEITAKTLTVGEEIRLEISKI